MESESSHSLLLTSWRIKKASEIFHAKSEILKTRRTDAVKTQSEDRRVMNESGRENRLYKYIIYSMYIFTLLDNNPGIF